MNKKHTQVPNKMAQDGLSPREQLVYAVVHSYNNKKNECFPSLQTLSEKSQLSIPTIRGSLKKLEDTGYIRIEKRGRQNYYYFEKCVNFEPFSPEFLDNKNITATTKAYLIAAQQWMYKDIEGIGKISYSNNSLSKQINMPESSIRKCNKELERKNYLTIIKNQARNLESGCKTDTKIFNLNELGQAIIWTLQDHEDRITQNTEEINLLKQQLKSQQELILKLLKDKEQSENKFTL